MPRRGRSRHRGAIFITALWVTVLLAGMVLVMCRSMQTEAVGSANRLSMAQADAVEKGVEQFLLCNVDGCKGDASTVTGLPAEAMPLGDGYFWILRPWPDATNDQQYGFGIMDEASKLNLNTATSKQLQNAPNVTQEIADAIVDWRDPDSTVTGSDGAESDTYNALSAFPYNAKNGDFETVEELLLVRDVTKDLLFGIDLNRDGRISPTESDQDPSGGGSSFGSNYSDRRGLYNYVTAYSVDPNLDATGTARVNVNTTDTTKVKTAMTNAGLDAGRVNQIMQKLASNYSAGNPTTPRRGRAQAAAPTPTKAATPTPVIFADMKTFYTAAGMQPTEMAKVFDVLTAKTGPVKGLVNVTTAPKQVLMALPGLEESDADAIVAQRGTNSSTTGAGWVFSAVTSTGKAYGIADSITSESYVYSADVVAVSGNGRTFKRVKVVVDGRTSPAKVIYRRDLTSYGWPLDPQIREQLKAGTFHPAQVTSEPAQGQPNNGLNSIQ